MIRRLGLCLVVLAALAVAPAALAAYPAPLAGTGRAWSPEPRRGQPLRRALPVGHRHGAREDRHRGRLAPERRQSSTARSASPCWSTAHAGDGLSRDGSFFVLQSTDARPDDRPSDRQHARPRRSRDSITLDGAFAYDALSPDGARLYLIQHSSANDFQHYVVRAYDLDAHTLLPGRIADKAQKGWVMQGFPVDAHDERRRALGLHALRRIPAATRSSTRSTPCAPSRTASACRGRRATRHLSPRSSCRCTDDAGAWTGRAASRG